MEITRGKMKRPQKVVLYGPEGIGKSTFASMFPDPVFIDTEGSTANLDVGRLPAPTSWSMLMQEIGWVKINKPCKTLVLDTADWAEKLCADFVCDSNHWKSISSPGYGTGYRVLWEEYGKMLNALTDVIEAGINVVITAHAAMRKFEQPDEQGSYDRWELKLQNSPKANIASLVKEWADMVLFANYKTTVVVQDSKTGKGKAFGGERVMYTTHHPCWDAKNRFGMPDVLPFKFAEIASIFYPDNQAAQNLAQSRKAEYETLPKVEGNGVPIAPPEAQKGPSAAEIEAQKKAEEKAKAEAEKKAKAETAKAQQKPENAAKTQRRTLSELLINSSPQNLPKDLLDLMVSNDVDEWEIQQVVGSRGYFPQDTPIENYPGDFIAGVLVGAWKQVYGMILEMRKSESVPFN